LTEKTRLSKDKSIWLYFLRTAPSVTSSQVLHADRCARLWGSAAGVPTSSLAGALQVYSHACRQIWLRMHLWTIPSVAVAISSG